MAVRLSQGAALRHFSLRRFFSSRDALAPINPLELEEDHVGKMYSVPLDDLKRLIPPDLSRSFMKQNECLNKVSWILRESSWTIMKSLKKKDNNRYLLYGPDGCGKTICLLQCTHYCMKDGWTVIYVPSVFKWNHSRAEVKQYYTTDNEGAELFDVPNENCLWLQQFKSINQQFLSQVTISRDYQWNKRDNSTTGDSLNKVIELGIAKSNISSDVIKAVLDEINQFNNDPILLAIDDINGCYSPTSYQHNGRYIEPHQINFIRHLKDFFNNEFNGATISATSRRLLRHVPKTSIHYDYLMGKEWMSSCGSFHPLFVPSFTRDELKLCLEYSKANGWFNKRLDGVSMLEMWYLTGGVPSELERLCLSL